MKKVFSLFLLFASAVLISCSLKYDTELNAEETNPEFTFTNTKLTRYEDAKITAEIEAGNIEQYQGTNETFGKKVKFMVYDDAGEIETEGECGLLYMDSDKDLYELYEKIKLYNKANNANFFSDALRWDGKTEQLTSGRSSTVRIEKDDTVIYGSGFSASGVSRRYQFTGMVSGEIKTQDAEENPEVENSENETDLLQEEIE